MDMGPVLRHGQRIDHLSAQMRDRFNELVASGEQQLRDGDYFAAERQFDRALRLAPGHPLANAGLANAQLGAGLYLSSALTLRNLFSLQPEMIDVRYSPDLLPKPERMATLIESIHNRMKDSAPADRASYGLLLAYIGHQTDRPAQVTEGLNIMAEADPQSTLLPLLREIWLNQGAAPEQPKAGSAPQGQGLVEPGK